MADTETPTPAPQQSWFARHKILTALLLLIALIIVASVAGGGGDGDDGTPAGDTTTAEGDSDEGSEARLFPDRPDAQPKDQERQPGQEAEVGGVAAKMDQAAYHARITDFEDDGYLVASVTLRNTSGDAEPYNAFNWKVQTPSGTVKDITFTSHKPQLEHGDLIAGGTVSGDVVFEIGQEKGNFYIIWKPEAFDAGRGIWLATV